MSIRNWIFKLSLRINGFDIERAKKHINKFQGETLEELRKRRDSIVDYHLTHNPLYQSICGNKDYSSFEDLPILIKQDFQRPISEIVSDGYRIKDLYVATTSGSSGHPFYYAKNKDCHANTHYIIQQLYASCGLDASDKQARFYGIPAKGISRAKEKIKDFLSNRVRFPVFNMTDEQLNVYLNQFKAIRFGYVYGYSSAIVLFAKFIIKNHITLKDICPSLKCCIVTSEMCLPEDKELIEKALGLQVINEYGCSEVGIIAFNNSDDVWEMPTQDCYYEVVDDSGKVLPYGVEGRLIITSLSNTAMPFIRYQVGDMGIIEPYKNGLKLTKLLGRVNDTVVLPSGKIAAGLTFYYISRSVIENSDNIKEFIIRQTKLDTFVFDVISKNELTDKDKKFLHKQMDVYLEPGLKILINQVDRINRPASGKIKHFYSELEK